MESQRTNFFQPLICYNIVAVYLSTVMIFSANNVNNNYDKQLLIAKGFQSESRKHQKMHYPAECLQEISDSDKIDDVGLGRW